MNKEIIKFDDIKIENFNLINNEDIDKKLSI